MTGIRWGPGHEILFIAIEFVCLGRGGRGHGGQPWRSSRSGSRPWCPRSTPTTEFGRTTVDRGATEGHRGECGPTMVDPHNPVWQPPRGFFLLENVFFIWITNIVPAFFPVMGVLFLVFAPFCSFRQAAPSCDFFLPLK